MNHDKAQASSEIAEGLPPRVHSPTEEIAESIRINEPSFMAVFFAWEKMRLLYNALMGVLVFFIVLKAGFSFQIGVWIAEGAIMANLSFCIGPIAEGYLCWLGLPHHTTRWVLFCWGCVISVVITAQSSHSFLFAN